jgi:hypothetical protein
MGASAGRKHLAAVLFDHDRGDLASTGTGVAIIDAVAEPAN